MKVTVKDGQTLADVAVQECGSWEAMIEIARENGMSMTEIPAACSELTVPGNTWNSAVQDYCKANDVSPATARDRGNVRLRIFEEEFKEQFK